MSQTFGRRALRTAEPAHRVRPAAPLPSVITPVSREQEAVAAPVPAPREAHDHELEAWKRERRRELPTRIPWRQLSLMASVCFGVASFVLPDSINDAVNWLLWLLTAASFYAWTAGRKRRRKQPPATA